MTKKTKEKQLLNAYIPADLMKEFKIKAAKDGVSMTEIVIGAIKDYLNDYVNR